MQNEFDNFSSDNQVEPSQPAPSGGGGSRLSSPIGNINKRPSGGKGGGTPGGNGGSPSSPPTTPSGKGAPLGGTPAGGGVGGKGGPGGVGGKGAPGGGLPAKKSGTMDGLGSKVGNGSKKLGNAVKSKGKELGAAAKQGYNEARAGNGVKEAGKKALDKGIEKTAEKTAEAAVAATGVGAPVAKAAGKLAGTVTKNGRWKYLLGAVFVPVFIVCAIIVYVISAPLEAVAKLGWQSFQTFRAIAGRTTAGSGIAASQALNDLNEKSKNLATNDIGSLNPSPGTIAYKLLNIDGDKIKKSTLSSGIPFELKTVKIAGPEGKTYNILDSVVSLQDGKVFKLSCIVNTNCSESNETIRNVISSILTQSIPIMEMSIRSPQARKLNKAPGLSLALNYTEKKNSVDVLSGSYDAISDFLNKKTTKRVRGTNIALPPISSYGSVEYKEVADSLSQLVSSVQKTVSDGGDPNDLDIQPPAPYDTNDMTDSPKRISNVLCAFNAILLDPSSISASIESRANAARRDGAKFMTIQNTNNANKMNNEELRYSISQMEDFTKSASYQRAAYGRIMGDSVDPEGSSQTALTIGHDNSILGSISNACSKLLYIDQMRKTVGISSLSDKVVDDEYKKEINQAKVTNADLRHYHANDSGGACNNVNPISPTRNDCASFAFRIAVMRNYFRPIQQSIYDDSDNYFSSPDDVTPLDIIQRLVRVGGGAAVTGREVGKQNYNRFAQGLQQLNYDWLQAYGGRFLTDTEQNTLALNQAKVRDWQNKNYGIAWRLYNTDNISSVASQIIQHTPPEPSRAIGAILNGILDCILNPIKTLASLDGLTSYVITGQTNIASAADTSVYDDAKFYKISPIGFTDKESMIDWQTNAKLIETMKKNDTEVADPDPLANGAKVPATQLFTKWDKCFTSKITSSYYLSNEYLLRVKARIDDLSNPDSPLMKGMDDDDKGKAQTVLSDLQAKYTLYMGCKPLLSAEANDVNSLPVQYRVYHLRSTILDSLDSLSTDAPDDSIYASSGATAGGSGDSSGQVNPVGGPGDTSAQACPSTPGITDAGIGEVYGKGRVFQFKIHLCKVQGTTVNVSIANNLNLLYNDIHAAGINLGGWGYRTFDQQISTRIKNHCPDIMNSPSTACNPQTAIPGTSNHEHGEAIDFTINGNTIHAGSPAFSWLKINAGKYGLKNLPSENWHWSTTGG